MRRPDPGNDKARGQAGPVSKDHYIGTADDSRQASEVNACQCRIDPAGCLVCRRWDRVIRGIEIRRADAIRRQWYSHQLGVGH